MSHNVRASTQLVAEVMSLMIGATYSPQLAARLQQAAVSLQQTGQLQPTAEVLREPGIAELAAYVGLASEHTVARGQLDSQQSAVDLTTATNLLTEMSSRLGRFERDAVAQVAVSVLGDHLGYTVQSESGDVATGIEAYLGDEVFLVAVMDGGELLVDQAGARDCTGRMLAFEVAMQKAGAKISRVAEVPHDPEHGPLIAQAAAAGEMNLAAGIARHGTRSGVKSTRANRNRTTSVELVEIGRIER